MARQVTWGKRLRHMNYLMACNSSFFHRPDVLKMIKDGYGREVDIWAFGLIYFFMVIGEDLFNVKHGDGDWCTNLKKEILLFDFEVGINCFYFCIALLTFSIFRKMQEQEELTLQPVKL